MPLEIDLKNHAASEAIRRDNDIRDWTLFLNHRMPEIMAADEALAEIAEARAAAAHATAKAAQLTRAIGPAETALRKAEARLIEAEAGTIPADRKAALAHIRRLEHQLDEARAALDSPHPISAQVASARALAENARQKHADALAAAETAAQEAKARKIAVAHTTANARAAAVKPTLRAYANECMRGLAEAGQPWQQPADMEAHPRIRTGEKDAHGMPHKDIRWW